MLLRKAEHGVLAIGQPSHGWVSGQLARAWGNERFGQVEPHGEVCLAAEQHDIGWASLDLDPLYNPETGLPRSFMEMPLDVHLGLWTDGPRRMLAQDRYAALLVSLHGWRLYERRELDRMPAPDADAIRRFLAGQRAFQEELIALLRADGVTAPAARTETIERNSMLIWTWDYLSLALCHGWDHATARDAPSVGRPVDLQLTAVGPGRVALDPWPFQAPSVTVRCEGRRLPERYESQEELRAAFAGAAWETLEIELSA